ncbi:MAG: biotin transporter BioY [Clostridiales bacterium]|nr:biotin transporter BioY [Clostridiales bacterium]
MSTKKQLNVKSLTVIAMMTAILCVLAPFSIPIGDIPISAATLVVYIAAVLLGTKRSLVCVGLYILIGLAGVPVFSGWKSGAAVIAGPTGGYLLGYLLIALLTGLFLKIGKGKIPMMVLGMVLGTISCYAVGTIWLAHQLSLTAKAALWAGVIPFLPGDIAKIVVTVLIAVPTRKHLLRFIEGN